VLNVYLLQKVMLTPGGESFELWRKPPVDLYLRVWLFNVTNKEAFMAGKEKLRVKETGPYVYKWVYFLKTNYIQQEY